VRKATISMNAEGRLTIPAAARRQLQIEGEALFELEVREDTLILRPAVVVPREDAWAYTPEHLRLLEQARQDAREGRVQRLDKADLERRLAE